MGNSYLPEDLLVLVLVRLPPETLYRFKSVSKSWKALISSSKFIQLHLMYQSCIVDGVQKLGIVTWFDVRDPRGGGGGGGRRYNYEQQMYGLEISISRDRFKLGSEYQFLQNPYEKHDTVGSCNGLLCQLWCISFEYHIVLCNPLINSFWHVTKTCSTFLSFYGFGYDDVHDDYKVMISSRIKPEGLLNYEYVYEVYSLRSHSWSKVRSYLDFDCWDTHYHEVHEPCGVLLNCALHWILNSHPHSGHVDEYYSPYNNSILAFDLRRDTNMILPLPNVLEGHYPLRLSVLNGCLLVIKGRSFDWDLYHHQEGDTESILDLWIMKDYGFKDSWTKITILNLDIIGCCPYDYIPISLLEGGNNSDGSKLIVIYIPVAGLVSLYDLVSHQFVEDIHVPRSSYQNMRRLEFVRSLVQALPSSD